MIFPDRYEEELLLFFSGRPGAAALYEALFDKISEAFPDTEVKIQKSQISFKARYGYAFVSLKKMKGCPEIFIILSFGLDRRIESPRIAVAVEPYPRRWTHHVIISSNEQLDDELMDWLRQAHDFALVK